jgi:hypothetical protein
MGPDITLRSGSIGKGRYVERARRVYAETLNRTLGTKRLWRIMNNLKFKLEKPRYFVNPELPMTLRLNCLMVAIFAPNGV